MSIDSNPGISSFGKGHTKVNKIPEYKRVKRYQKSKELKDLERLSLDAKRLRYPNNPYLVGDTFRDDTANGLTKAIIAFIRLNGGQAERISTTGRTIDRVQTFTDVLGYSRQIGSAKWIPGSSTRGSADISATIAGRSVKIEVKIGTDRQSQAQRDYQKQIETAFGIYYIARNFESFSKWYNQMFKR